MSINKERHVFPGGNTTKGFYSFYKYIADGMKGEPVFATLEQATYIVKLTEAIVKSSKERKWIHSINIFYHRKKLIKSYV